MPNHPDDLNGRTITANQVKLMWDGSHICALVGKDLMEGMGGFGLTVHEALRDLADQLVKNGIWVEIPG